MGLNEALIAELDFEVSVTKPVLERVPNDRLEWRPHTKSMTFAGLAGHVAEIVGWTVPTLKLERLDLMPKDGPGYQPTIATSAAHAVELLLKNASDARAALASTSDEELFKPWTLLAAEKEIFAMPRIAVVRGFVIKHLVHHRAQLGLYLRLNDIAVPAVYGPSADEGGM